MSTNVEIGENIDGGLGEPAWAGLVERVRSGEPAGLEELYRVFSKGIRFYLCRQLGPQDLDDKVHDIFLIITQSIQKGDLREPERLMGYVRTVVRRQVAAHIDNAVKQRRNQTDLEFGVVSDQASPESRIIEQQNMQVALRVLKSLRPREREVLMRFYLDEQTPDEICNDLGLTETQFRLIKSRAKARFGKLARNRLSMRAGFHF